VRATHETVLGGAVQWQLPGCRGESGFRDWSTPARVSSSDAVTDARIKVRVRVGSRKDELIGVSDGVMLARVSALPVDGRANRALRRLIARRVGVSLSRVTIVCGERGRDKLIRVDGVDQVALNDALTRQ
jgi:uncharacterized protein